ncbi:vps10, partial [Symbiodinium pilosum]
MGIGNVGPQLSFESHEVNTYLSRDGGLNWQEVRKGVHIYEFGNHGAVLVMADILADTDAVIYSMDEGQSWQTLHLSTKMNVTNILTEPRAVATKFLAYGTVGGAGVVQYLDFDALGWMPCRKPDHPNDDGSDYETWSPSDGFTADVACLLGQQTRYVRRKRSTECFNRRETKLPVVSESCSCRREDFECEVGFELAVDSNNCIKSSIPLVGFVEEDPPECKLRDTYTANMYRRIPGDHCENGWYPPQYEVRCKETSVSSGGSLPGSLKLVLLVLAVAVVLYVARSDRFQD